MKCAQNISKGESCRKDLNMPLLKLVKNKSDAAFDGSAYYVTDAAVGSGNGREKRYDSDAIAMR